jgi:methionyl-tRNA formyltransferase
MAMSIDPTGANEPTRDRIRVAYLTMRCQFAVTPLLALWADRVEVAAVVVPGFPDGKPWQRPRSPARTKLPRVRQVPSTIDEAARLAGTDIVSVSRIDHPEVERELRALGIDLLVSVCFPRKVPPEVIATARLGALNVHPSLLPRWRGPEPLFWTFHAGDRETGVTIHELSSSFDTGPIIQQRAWSHRLGSRYRDVESSLETLGAVLLKKSVRAIASGDAVRSPQTGEPTWAPTPRDADYVIDPTWDTERAFRFARGVAGLGGPLQVRRSPSAEPEPVADAVTFWTDDGVTFLAPSTPVAGTFDVRFRDGTVRFVVG